MGWFPFFSSNKHGSKEHVFMLMLAEDKAFGFAFNETSLEQKSLLYIESIDPYLKDTADVFDKMLENCEKDLGKEIYLQKTVFILNSFYITQSGSVKEEFRKQITKLCKELDLEDLGYMTTYELMSYEYGRKYKKWVYVEETAYNYNLYFFDHNKQIRQEKVAVSDKTFNKIQEVAKGTHVVAWLKEPVVDDVESAHMIYFDPHDVHTIGVSLYKENQKDSSELSQDSDSAEDTYENTQDLQKHEKTSKDEFFAKKDTESKKAQSSDKAKIGLGIALPEAPGFKSEDEDNNFYKPVDIAIDADSDNKDSGVFDVEKEQSIFDADDINKNEYNSEAAKNGFFIKQRDNFFKLLSNIRFTKKSIVVWIVILVFVFAGGIGGYIGFLHKATIIIATNKKNFSTTVKFRVGEGEAVAKEINGAFSVKSETRATGEKVIGENAKGKVIIYNGFFQAKTLPQSTVFKDSAGVRFVLTQEVTIPSATTSATIGKETKEFGKKSVSMTAESVGAEANISKNIKLTPVDFDENNIYAISTQEFSGGFKKTVIVLSQNDISSLEKKANTALVKKVQSVFNSTHNSNNTLLIQTITTPKDDVVLSAEAGDEVRSANIEKKGTYKAYFIDRDALRKYVQTTKLKDKEFVQGTFSIGKLNMEKKLGEQSWQFRAIVNGKIQQYFDKKALRRSIVGAYISQAEKKLSSIPTIQSFTIKTYPMPLPLIPFSQDRIAFEFVDNK